MRDIARCCGILSFSGIEFITLGYREFLNFLPVEPKAASEDAVYVLQISILAVLVAFPEVQGRHFLGASESSARAMHRTV